MCYHLLKFVQRTRAERTKYTDQDFETVIMIISLLQFIHCFFLVHIINYSFWLALSSDIFIDLNILFVVLMILTK